MKIEQAFSFPTFGRCIFTICYSDVFAIDVYFDYFSYLTFSTFSGQ